LDGQIEVFMTLALRSVVGSPGDHHVMHGEWQVGQIEKRPALIGTEPRWIWSLNGVPWGTPKEMHLAGVARSLDEATAEVKKSFEQWLAWAQLSGAGITSYSRPAPSKSEGVSNVKSLDAPVPTSVSTVAPDRGPRGAADSDLADVKIMNILVTSDPR
jgi:hypothetical protein